MPIFMDVHIIPGVKAKDVAEAHRLDLLHQHEHGCNCMTYWIDEARESIFCLIEAKDKEAVVQMHQQAHGMLPNRVIEVDGGLVESFLGRIYDPADARVTSDGLKVFAEPSFRVILVTKTTDPVLLKHRLGADEAASLAAAHSIIIRNQLQQHGGKEVQYSRGSFVISFTAADDALACALAITQHMPADIAQQLNLKMGISAGEPLEQTNGLFENAFQFAKTLGSIAPAGKIALASQVKQLTSEELYRRQRQHVQVLAPKDEELMKQLFGLLAQHWRDGDFDLTHYCRQTAMSSSQLYRKTITLTGLPPKAVIQQYRLQQAKKLLQQQHYNIAQVTYDAGFSSASYFTKCFKKQYGLLPMAYTDLLED